jgi:hypothetical protein
MKRKIKDFIDRHIFFFTFVPLCFIIMSIPVGISWHNRSKAINTETYIVYVTEYGECYHTQDCYCIKNSEKIPITLEEAMDRGYRPCQKCNPPDVYFWYYGDDANVYGDYQDIERCFYVILQKFSKSLLC